MFLCINVSDAVSAAQKYFWQLNGKITENGE
jgi:hypothetical protein